MSFLTLIKASMRLFKKDVITFLIIRRHDFGVIDDKLRYIAVKPNASISVLRQKVWHLLDLPDFCEEIIILKTGDDCEIPLTQLRKGNDPQHPYILEVWMPGKQRKLHGMLTMGTGDGKGPNTNGFSEASSMFEENINLDLTGNQRANTVSKPQLFNDTVSLNKLRIMKNLSTNILPDCKQSEISCKFSTSSLFYKIHGRKSRDNFANILMKIQSDLNTLTNKLSNLENKIQL